MHLTTSVCRRENLGFLVIMHSSQRALAEAVPSAALTQPIISLILKKKRSLLPQEARAIEADLNIPLNWLDRYLLTDVWKLWRRFRVLPPEQVALFNEMLAFIDAPPPEASKPKARGLASK